MVWPTLSSFYSRNQYRECLTWPKSYAGQTLALAALFHPVGLDMVGFTVSPLQDLLFPSCFPIPVASTLVWLGCSFVGCNSLSWALVPCTSWLDTPIPLFSSVNEVLSCQGWPSDRLLTLSNMNTLPCSSRLTGGWPLGGACLLPRVSPLLVWSFIQCILPSRSI